MRLLLPILLALLATTADAQTKKKRRKESPEAAQQLGGPTSLDPNAPMKQYGPKKTNKRKASAGPTYESQEEFEARMRETVKAIRRNERLMDKPQYSDPMYFGHKRPPKKRPPHKMKFCKVCGIRH